ncbi:MAG: hypothetical protein NNA30_00040 [Nitrospira sp.]|nr:hypothetical protein [Nitrospira sp.]
MAAVAQVPWDRLSRKRICFGHQSVGKNLIDGLMAGRQGRLNVVESSDPKLFRHPVFAHFRVGQNRDPLAKFEDFKSVMTSGVGESVDVAFFKLCYVDITDRTDVENLFNTYRRMMDDLALTYSAVTFLHVTVPLRRLESGVLQWIKTQWRGDDRERLAQIKRHAYNELLRAAYGPSGRLFDLAEAEATYPDGRLSAVRYQGETIPNLVSDYTDDGGHLNERAAERIAARLLACIGSIEETVSGE